MSNKKLKFNSIEEQYQILNWLEEDEKIIENFVNNQQNKINRFHDALFVLGLFILVVFGIIFVFI
jgi:uncharacterized membrane protein